MVRYGLYTAATAVLLLACIAAYAAYLLNGDAVRLRVQTSLSHALGRPVTMVHLRLSPWTGTTVADDFQVAEDAAFSNEPFIRAQQVHIGLDIRELLLHRRIALRSIALQGPTVRLLRNRAGTWNYASLASTHATGAERREAAAPTISIASIAIDAGSVLVQTTAADGTAVCRAFTINTAQVYDVGEGKTSRFQLAVQLPGGGTVAASGTAGPWSGSGTVHLPMQAHLQATHLQLLAAGLVPADSPVTGDLRQVNADVRWSDSGLLVSRLDVDSPRLAFRSGRERNTQAEAVHSTATVWSHLLEHLVVTRANVHVNAVDIHRADGGTVHLRETQAVLGEWSPGARADFRVSTALGGGTLHAVGSLRAPVPDGQSPDLVADVTTAHLRLASSGLLGGEGAGLDAVTDSAIHLQVGQSSVQAAGTFRLGAARLVHGGPPLPMPLSGSFRLHQTVHEREGVGTLEALTVQVGGATLHAAGSYGWGAGAPTARLTVAGDRMPVDALEAVLPSVGILLPEGSRLQGGTLSLSLAVQGPLAHPEVNGPIQLLDTRLAGYDLGSKLRGLASFTGGRIGSATINGTQLRRLSLTLHAGAGPTVTDHLEADIAGIGTATGAGSIGPGGALDYRLTLKLNELIPGAGGPSGLANELVGALPPAWAQRLQGAVRYLSEGPMKNGVPVLIRGTARKPTVTPNLGALIPAERLR